MKKLQVTFNKKYLASNRIGLGSKSEVYLAYELNTEKELAIKADPVDFKDSTIEREAKIYRIVKGGTGVPNLYWYGVENNLRVLVTDILGPSLEQLMKYCKGTFSLKTVLLIADQILERIEWVHTKGLVYNNVEPSNFLVGLAEKQDKIFIVDFRNCQRYIGEEGHHIDLENEGQKMKTNVRFQSINTHIGKRTGRRDDLESLGYMLVYFFKNKLPWDDIDIKEPDSDLQIKERKSSTPSPLLCEGLPEQFVRYFEYVKTLEYEEEPDYIWMRRMFKDLFQKSGLNNNRVLDWAERHQY